MPRAGRGEDHVDLRADDGVCGAWPLPESGALSTLPERGL